METSQVIGITIATYIVLNVCGKVILEYTKGYTKTDGKIDDHINKFVRSILKALKFINDTILNRY